MSMNTQLIPDPFHNDTLVLVDDNGTPFVAMRPIVENMGLAWQVQHRKLSEKFASTVTIMVTVGEDGRNRDMVCLPLRKLPAWLYSVNPNKVAPAIADKVRQYQDECDDVLWEYWTTGQVNRKAATASRDLASLVRPSMQAADLIERLRITIDPAARRALYAGVVDCHRVLGIAPPPLDELRPLIPDEPAGVAEIWQLVDELQAVGETLNHSRRPELFALHVPHLVQIAKAHGKKLPTQAIIKFMLRQSVKRVYLGSRVVNSLYTNKAVRCMVFAHTPVAVG